MIACITIVHWIIWLYSPGGAHLIHGLLRHVYLPRKCYRNQFSCFSMDDRIDILNIL